MSAFLLIPLFESLGLSSAIAGLATEVGVSTSIAGAIGSTAAGAIAGEIGSKIDEQVPTDIKNKVAKGKDTGNRIFNDYKAVAKSLYAQDPRYIIQETRNKSGYFTQKPQKPQKPQTTQTTQTQQQEINKLYGTQPNQPLVLDNRTDRYQYTEFNYDKLYNQLSTQTEIVFEPVTTVASSSENEDLKDNEDEEYFERKVYEEAYETYQYSPRDIGRYLIDYARDLAITRNPVETIQNILEMNPSFYGLSKKITTYLSDKTLPTSDDYKEIANIYNFSNITYQNFSIARNAETNLIEVTFIDEVGEVHTLPQNTGLILPSVPGCIFMGPYSKNDALPNEFRLEDWASMDHDWFYDKENYFSREGDLRFISRLSACLKNGRILPQNRQLVESTIIYFSTVSLTLGLFKNGSVKTKPQAQPSQEQQSSYVEELTNDESVTDIFSIFGSPQAMAMPPIQSEEYTTLRNTFYDIMTQELVEYNKTDGFFTTARNNFTENAFADLEVQLN